MRENKFRAWDERYGKYVYSPNDNDLDVFWADVLCGDIGLGGVEQFTGLRDKNGNDIYEGDILSASIFFEGYLLPHIGMVVYSEQSSAFGTKNESGTTLFCRYATEYKEVIGNIHENPELLT